MQISQCSDNHKSCLIEIMAYSYGNCTYRVKCPVPVHGACIIPLATKNLPVLSHKKHF